MKLVVFDMDGTLSDDRARRPAYEAKDWPAYWNEEAMLSEPAWPEALRLIRQHEEAGDQVGVLTARLEDYNRAVTEKWLFDQGLFVTPVILRDDENKGKRPPEFKLFVMKYLRDMPMYDQVVLYDNDIEVVNLITEELGPEFVIHATWETAEGEPA